jgi:excisionase family DNA binding protein
MRTDKPLLVSIAEASFQLSLPNDEIAALIRDGELVAVKVRDQVLVLYDSLTAFTRRARRNRAVAEVARDEDRG